MLPTLFQPHSQLFKALASPKRLEIVHLLRTHCMRVEEIQRMTGMTQANVSQHLQVLRRCNVVVPQRTGKAISYCLSHPRIVHALDDVQQILVDRKKVNSAQSAHKTRVPIPQVIDPVCGMSISPQTAVLMANYRRSTYYFCASGCHAAFTKKPEHYV
ncbi:MAG: metalloregulator ArsR/SmtB family transcription factor [Candidatus Kerfeldbacteria bacterium]|nr:metalloregulator ArsR/SmtB family transcription factor [Candidatus Kerfeldbacteria bacterium]